jgi:hypothetical protein
MSIVRQAINALIAPTVAAAIAPLQERVAALEDNPGLSEADQLTLAKAATMVAEFEALANNPIEAAPAGGSITITDVTP